MHASSIAQALRMPGAQSVMDTDENLAALSPRPPDHVGSGGTDPTFLAHDANVRNWQQRVRRAKQRKRLLNDSLTADQRRQSCLSNDSGCLSNPARTAAEAACEAAAGAKCDTLFQEEVSILMLGLRIEDATQRVDETDASLQHAYLVAYPETGSDDDCGVEVKADERNIDKLLIIQNERDDELNTLLAERIKLAIPGFGVPRLKPPGNVPKDKDGAKSCTWDALMGCWRNGDRTVFIQLSSNDKRKEAMIKSTAELRAICERVDKGAIRRLHESGLSTGSACSTNSVVTINVDDNRLVARCDLDALGVICSSSSVEITRHPAYWGHVDDIMAESEGGRITRSNFKYHLRAVVTGQFRALTNQALAALKKREQDFAAIDLERRAMETQDSRLHSERERTARDQWRARQLIVDRHYANMRDHHEFSCNGQYGNQHRPCLRFFPTIDTEWDLWTATEFEAWRRDLAENIGWYSPRCSGCFEVEYFSRERRAELNLLRESSLVAKMRDDETFRCTALVRDVKPDRIPSMVTCGVVFHPTQPPEWEDTKFGEWCLRLVRSQFYNSIRSSDDSRNACLVCQECFSATFDHV
jgi:hypothetical protein